MNRLWFVLTKIVLLVASSLAGAGGYGYYGGYGYGSSYSYGGWQYSSYYRPGWTYYPSGWYSGSFWPAGYYYSPYGYASIITYQAYPVYVPFATYTPPQAIPRDPLTPVAPVPAVQQTQQVSYQPAASGPSCMELARQLEIRVKQLEQGGLVAPQPPPVNQSAPKAPAATPAPAQATAPPAPAQATAPPSGRQAEPGIPRGLSLLRSQCATCHDKGTAAKGRMAFLDGGFLAKGLSKASINEMRVKIGDGEMPLDPKTQKPLRLDNQDFQDLQLYLKNAMGGVE